MTKSQKSLELKNYLHRDKDISEFDSMLKPNGPKAKKVKRRGFLLQLSDEERNHIAELANRIGRSKSSTIRLIINSVKVEDLNKRVFIWADYERIKKAI
jgi:predicted DNA-binding protein